VRWRKGVAEVARAALAVEQVERAVHPEPQATQAAGPAVRAATALLNPLAAKAVRMAMALLNPPAARAKIVLTPQGRELGRGTVLRALKVNCNRHQGAALPWDNQGIDLRFPAIAMIQASVQAFTSAPPLRHEPSELRAAR
jgi:hypothetical protein